ncbi:MAG: CocE/NonD family hydrolase [Minicystis sp.]
MKVAGIDPGQRALNGIQTTGRSYRNLSQPAHAIREEHDLEIPVRDGITLVADVLRPDAEGRFPALVAFSPYPRQLQNSGAPLGFIEAGASDYFVPRGYAHVLVNARGTCGSGGTYTMLDATERGDLYDAVEWAAAQPWCNGKVALIGVSYFAMAALAGAVETPPHLAAVFPLGSTIDFYRSAWHGGMLSARFIGAWMAGLGVMSGGERGAFRGVLTKLASSVLRTPAVHHRFESFQGEAALAVLGKYMRISYERHPWEDLYAAAAIEHPLYDAFWQDRDLTPKLASVRIPAYLGCDWDNVPLHLPGTIKAFQTMPRDAGHRLMLLPRGGMVWPWESMHVEALAWFDARLKGVDTGVDEGAPVRYWLAGEDAWREAPSWPPPGVHWEALHLRADGVLARDAGTDGERAYLVQPPSMLRPANAPPPALPDRLTWETPALREPLDVVGPLVLELDATTTAPDVDWIVKLELITADGTAHDLTQGWLRGSHRAVDPDRSAPGEPFHAHDRVEAVTPHAPTRYAIGLVSTAQRVLPGQRLRVTLMSNDAGAAMLGFEHLPLGLASIQRVRESSVLQVPVLGGALPRAAG